MLLLPGDQKVRSPLITIAKPARVYVILNTSAAGFVNRPVREICNIITSRFAVHGIAAEIVLAVGGALDKRVHEAIGGGLADAVIAGGGDGTVSAVATTLVDTGVPLGILPLGRFNHFARDTGIPQNLEQAVEVIAAGHCVSVDAGEVNGRVFVNNSSLGAYPFLVIDRERRRRRSGVRGAIAYVLAAIRLIRLFPLRRFTLRTGEWSEICRTPCLFVGNNRYLLEPFALGRRPRLDAGQLWIYIARQQTRLRLVWFTFKCLIGLTDPGRDLRIFQLLSAEIGARAHRLEVAIDGEVIRMRPPLRYRIRPASLRVYVPCG